MRRVIAAALLLAAALTMTGGPVHAAAPGCHRILITADTPTGIAGCRVYGEGIASAWGGPGIARNDCLWPWTDCAAIAVLSLDTGLRIIEQPRMFCDCFTGTSRQRIVDLDPAAIRALGLDPGRGLYRVQVWAVDARSGQPTGSQGIPDTATAP